MKLRKSLASVVAGSVLAGAAMVAAASPALANDEGTLLSGGIYWFNTVGPLASQTPANQVTSGSGTVRPWATLTTENACPAGTTQMYSYVRVPQNGVPENDWPQIPMGATTQSVDADGRYYTTTTAQADRMGKPDVVAYLQTAPGNTGTFPFIAVCRDNGGNPTGYFRTTVAISGTSSTTLSWTIASPTFAGIQSPTTTTLAASASTVESGSPVTLTATVDPSTATGNVEFLNGSTSLGTAALSGGVAALTTSALPIGSASITAVYAGDAGNKTSTSSAVGVTVTAVAPRSTTSTVASVSPSTGDAYVPVTIACEVAASTGLANGTMRILDGAAVLGTVVVTDGVVPTLTTNVLGAGAHSITCDFVGTAPYSGSTSAAFAATYTLSGAVDEQTVTVEIPVGAITITTPYTPASPLALGVATLDTSDSTYSASAPFSGIVITDTRSGNLGFTASVISSAFAGPGGASFPAKHAGLTGLVAHQVAGNAMDATKVAVTDHSPWTDGLDSVKAFAKYPAGQPLGTVNLDGVFGVDQVPTSVAPGTYTATVTFTAV